MPPVIAETELTPSQAAEVERVARAYRKRAVRFGVVVGLLVGVTAACIVLWAMGLGRCP